MAIELPYSLTPGKISELFKKIYDAKIPDTFVHSFLRDTLGLKSTNDRSFITLLKNLGMLEQSGTPTARYRALKNGSSKGKAIAEGIKHAYGPLFAANENAQTLGAEELKGLIAQVAGTDMDMTSRICSTFLALVKEASFGQDDRSLDENAATDTIEPEKKSETRVADPLQPMETNKMRTPKGNTEFHFNIQVHLPNNGTEETYLNIFNAIREAFD